VCSAVGPSGGSEAGPADEAPNRTRKQSSALQVGFARQASPRGGRRQLALKQAGSRRQPRGDCRLGSVDPGVSGAGPRTTAMGPFLGCLTLAPGVMRPRDSPSDVAGYRSTLRGVSSRLPLARRTPEGVHRPYRTRPPSRVAPESHRRVEGSMVRARAVGDHHPGRELAVAHPIVAVQLEQGRIRTLCRIAVFPQCGCLRGTGLRPAALGSRLVLLRARPDGPGRRPGAGRRRGGRQKAPAP
jgi:hypothetical protein